MCALQALQFDFRPIADIETMENNAIIDVMGVVVAVGQTQSIMRRNGTETHKRTAMLRDESGRQVELTMWGGFCQNDGEQIQVRMGWYGMTGMAFCVAVVVELLWKKLLAIPVQDLQSDF